MPLSPARMALPGEALDSIARYPAVSDARLESDAERTGEMTGVSVRPTGAMPLAGELWSTRAHDWAELMEPAMRQLYAAILDRIAPPTGATLLDAGCGAGLFCRLAVTRGATVSGVD